LKDRKGKRGSDTPFLNISDTKMSLAETYKKKHYIKMTVKKEFIFYLKILAMN